ncbi:MAG: histidine phosphatase family protein [Proteobacteria bacterium]|nr:histidine phosphatase family protein [Pseudomonadota bacterium]
MPIPHNARMDKRLPSTFLLSLLLAACASTPKADVTPGATFIVVRHAEKASDSARDPDLSAAGLARAQQLAQRLAGERVVAIYTTDYRRTRQTVQPTAQAQGVGATVYDAQQAADAFAASLRAAHPRGTVLVAGHSNTVPGIVAALCACAVDDMPDREYDRLSLVRVAADGRARLDVQRYGAPSPAR